MTRRRDETDAEPICDGVETSNYVMLCDNE